MLRDHTIFKISVEYGGRKITRLISIDHSEETIHQAVKKRDPDRYLDNLYIDVKEFFACNIMNCIRDLFMEV